MKKIYLLIAMSIACITANAQSGRFSAGLELGLPMGDNADFYSLGIGVTARYEYPVADKISLIGTAGYQSFTAKEIEIPTLNGTEKIKPDPAAIIPIQVGAKYYFKEAWSGLYASAELGLHMFTFDGGSESNLGFATGIGYCVGKNIDLGLRYQIIPTEGSSFDYIGIRAAYVFGGK